MTVDDHGRPNILFILSDQHNPKIAGFAGNSVVRTPSLDRLATEGMTFDSAYCQSPLCVPSRMSMLTGQYCRTTGIYDNQDILPSNSRTFPRHFSENGYATCLIGKAHLNGEQFQGYQQRPYGDLFGQAHQPDPRRLPGNYAHGLGDIPEQAGPSRIPLALTQTEITTAEAAKFLQTHIARSSHQPFLLSVHYDKPHFPINPPEQYFRYYEKRVDLSDHWRGEHGTDHLDSLVPFVRENFVSEGYYTADEESHRRALAAYYGCVEWIDDSIGRLLDVVEYLGLASNTIVVYASDHGEMASEHGAWQKMVFYEESARVPLIIRDPSSARAGARCDAPVGLIDLYPTLCDAAGISTPDSCEGISLASLIDGGEQATARECVFSESVLIKKPEHAGCMVRQGQFKYSYYLDGHDELYDLENDPGENRNLSENPRQTDIRQALRKRIIDFWEPEKQIERYHGAPKMPHEKHFYPYSNQFVLGDGTIVDARP